MLQNQERTGRWRAWAVMAVLSVVLAHAVAGAVVGTSGDASARLSRFPRVNEGGDVDEDPWALLQRSCTSPVADTALGTWRCVGSACLSQHGQQAVQFATRRRGAMQDVREEVREVAPGGHLSSDVVVALGRSRASGLFYPMPEPMAQYHVHGQDAGVCRKTAPLLTSWTVLLYNVCDLQGAVTQRRDLGPATVHGEACHAVQLHVAQCVMTLAIRRSDAMIRRLTTDCTSSFKYNVTYDLAGIDPWPDTPTSACRDPPPPLHRAGFLAVAEVDGVPGIWAQRDWDWAWLPLHQMDAGSLGLAAAAPWCLVARDSAHCTKLLGMPWPPLAPAWIPRALAAGTWNATSRVQQWHVPGQAQQQNVQDENNGVWAQGLRVLERDGRIIDVNDGAVRFFSWHDGQPPDSLFQPPRPCRGDDGDAVLRTQSRLLHPWMVDGQHVV